MLVAVACSSTASQGPTAAAVTDPAGRLDAQYTDAFNRRSGWTGADGVYSVPLAGDKTLWLFSDTLVGTVDESGRRTLSSRAPKNAFGLDFLHNSAGVSTGAPANTRFFLPEKDGVLQHLFEPPDGVGWFWLNDAVLNADDTITVLLNQFRKSDDPLFAFGEQISVWAARCRLEEDRLRVLEYHEISSVRWPEAGPPEPEIVYGAAIHTEGPWHYIYNAQMVQGQALGIRHMTVARAPVGELHVAQSWTFLAGEQWVERVDEAQPIPVAVANEMSVDRLPQGYVLVSHDVPSAQISICGASTPLGPWSEPVVVWKAPESRPSVITYNAKAHPHLSDDDGLLVSYNVNSTVVEDSLYDAEIYHPRFIRIPWTTIEELFLRPGR